MWLRFIWDVEKCLNVDTSGYLLFRHRKLFDYMYSNILCIVDLRWFRIKLSNIGKSLRSVASWSSNRNRCVLSCVFSCAFHPLVSVGSSAAEAMSIPFSMLVKQSKPLISYNFIQLLFCLLLYLSLLLRVFMFVFSRMDFVYHSRVHNGGRGK